MAEIRELEQRIREYINAPRKHLAIYRDKTEYHKLCSCLDVIGDTELAFSAHEEMPDSVRPGSSYILVYGFLQALFLQQDAVRNLHEALQLPYEADPLLLEIRELRNDATGHPTKRDRGKGKKTTFSYISRPSISKAGFQLITITPNEWPPVFRHVSAKALLGTQRAQLKKALDALLQSLQKEEMEHREQFRQEKFAALFPGVLGYYFEKVYESVRASNAWEYGALHISLIREIVEKFKAALTKRQIIGAYQGVDYQLELLEYPLTQLAEYFAQQGKGRLNTRDAEIFTSFVESEMAKLHNMAQELDAEYAEEP
jgi:hypothetical protein